MGDTTGTTDDGLTETRWRRYGKDRIYLRTAEGQTVGHVDLVTRQAVVSDPAHSGAVHARLDRWLAAEQPAPASPATAPAPTMWAPPVVPPAPGLGPPRAIDLASNVAGAAARAQRDAVNAEAPVRNLLARVLGVKTDERNWRIGAKGEQKIGRELTTLGPAWRVLHAIPVGDRGSDIDHLVIGPGGVYTLNAKCHPGGKAWIGERVVLVNGHRTDYLRNARFEARRTAKLLTSALHRPVDVQPVIVFVDLAGITVKQQPDDVHVITRRRVAAWFQGRPAILSAADIDTIYDVARLTRTWQR